MLDNQGFINVFSIAREFKKRKILFFAVFLSCVVASVVFSILATPKYKASITLLPVPQAGEAALNSGLGSFSSLFRSGGVGSVEMPSWYEATIIMKTYAFSKNFILSQNLMQILIDEHGRDIIWDELSEKAKKKQLTKIAMLWVKKHVEIEINEETNIVSFSVYSANPDFAVNWSKKYISDINEYMKVQLINELEHKISFYRERIEKERIGDIKISLIGLLVNSIQKKALIDTRKEIVLRTIDPAELAILNFPILLINLAIGMFLGLMLGFLTVIFLAIWKQYKEIEEGT